MFPPLSELIPHCGPAILLSGVAKHTSESTQCTARVDEKMQYVNAGRADAVLALELLAQTAAAHAGLLGRDSAQAPRVGYVVGVPSLKFFGGDYREGEELLITVSALVRVGPLLRMSGEVHSGGQLRAEGVLTVFEPPLAE